MASAGCDSGGTKNRHPVITLEDFEYDMFQNEKANPGARSDRVPVNERTTGNGRPRQMQVKKKKITFITKLREQERLRFQSKLPTPGWTSVNVDDALSKYELIRAELPKSGRQAALACGKMRKRHPRLFLYPQGKEGPVPEVEVGRKVNFRAHLAVLGIHRPLRKGIDWKEVTNTRRDGNSEIIAISVVFSGEYEDDADQGEVVIYTGEGGRDTKSGRQIEDQKLENGNLALYNAYFREKSVRFVRCQSDANSVSGKFYIYDGMYKVEDWEKVEGVSRFTIFKFKLVREANQKPLDWSPRVPKPFHGQGKRKGESLVDPKREEEKDLIASEEEEEDDLSIRNDDPMTSSESEDDDLNVFEGEDGGDFTIHKEPVGEGDGKKPRQPKEEEPLVDIKHECTIELPTDIEQDLTAIVDQFKPYDLGSTTDEGLQEVHCIAKEEVKDEINQSLDNHDVLRKRPLASDEGEEDSDQNCEYEVERILKKRIVSRRKKKISEYLIHWKGYPLEEATWEPGSNLTHCPHKLAEFEGYAPQSSGAAQQ